MSNNILFVFEGKRREDIIVSSLQKNIFKQKQVIKCVFGAEIYQLYSQINDDDFLDIFSLIKEKDQSLASYHRDDFAEIYLFFDYDAHASLLGRDGDAELSKMFVLFDNETGNGKLYISYPMVEALWHIADYADFHQLTVRCKGKNCSFCENTPECDECKKEPHYKQIVSEQCIPQLVNVNSYNADIWCRLMIAHLCKVNYILTDNNEFPRKVSSQGEIFDCQYKKNINKRCPAVAVLSAFPVFVHDYFGNDRTRKILDIE